MSAGKQFIRQWRLLKLLDANYAGLAVDDMLQGLELAWPGDPANEREAARRTLYRDLKVLQNVGFPIVSERHSGKMLYLLDKQFQPKVPEQEYALTELVSIYFARQLLLSLKTPFGEGIESFYRKLRSYLPDKAFEFLDELANVLVVNDKGFRRYRKHTQMLEDIRKAIEDERKLEVVHTALEFDKPVKHLFDPYVTLYHNGSLYLYGFSHRAKAERMFKIDRIERIKVTDETFERPTDFDIGKRLRPAFGIIANEKPVEVKIKFDRIAAKLVSEDMFHPSQRLIKNKDGSFMLTMKVSGLLEVKNWVLWFGKRATVLEPQSLRDKIIKELESARGNYAEGPANSKALADAERPLRQA
jgi:proteasome accessory factor B